MSGSPGQARTVSAGQLVLVVSTAIRLVLALIVTVFLGRTLSPSDFGFYSFVVTLFVFSRELMDLGTGNFAVREISLEPSRERPLLETLIALRVAVGAGLLVLLLVVALSHERAEQQWLLVLTALVVPMLSLGAVTVVFQLRQSQLPPAVIAVTLQAGLLIGFALLYTLEAPVWSFAAAFIAREAIAVAWLGALTGKRLGYFVWPRFRYDRMRHFFARAAVIGSAAAVYSFYFFLGPLLIWFIRPEDEMGAFSAAFRPISQLLAFPWILTLPLLPVLTHLARKERSIFNEQAAYLVPLFVGLGTVVAVAGRELGADVLMLLYGAKYATGSLSAVSTFEWLALSFGFALATPVLVTLLLADRREKLLLPMSLAGLVVNLLLNLSFLPTRAFPTAALATFAAEMCVFVFATILAVRFAIFQFSWSMLVRFLLPAAALALVLQLLPDQIGWPRLAGALFATGIAAATALLMPCVRDGRRRLDEHAIQRSISFDESAEAGP